MMALVLASGVGVAFLLSVVGAYLLARKALSPVSAVVTAAHRITEGDRSKRLPVANSKDEIGDPPPPLTVCSLISKDLGSPRRNARPSTPLRRRRQPRIAYSAYLHSQLCAVARRVGIKRPTDRTGERGSDKTRVGAHEGTGREPAGARSRRRRDETTSERRQPDRSSRRSRGVGAQPGTARCISSARHLSRGYSG